MPNMLSAELLMCIDSLLQNPHFHYCICATFVEDKSAINIKQRSKMVLVFVQGKGPRTVEDSATGGITKRGSKKI